MTAEIGSLREHAIVCGYGRIGRILAGELRAANMAFAVVDADEAKVREALEAGFPALHGDATQEETLAKLGVAHARVLAAVLAHSLDVGGRWR